MHVYNNDVTQVVTLIDHSHLESPESSESSLSSSSSSSSSSLRRLGRGVITEGVGGVEEVTGTASVAMVVVIMSSGKAKMLHGN